jgi:hypothetical protein
MRVGVIFISEVPRYVVIRKLKNYTAGVEFIMTLIPGFMKIRELLLNLLMETYGQIRNIMTSYVYLSL